MVIAGVTLANSGSAGQRVIVRGPLGGSRPTSPLTAPSAPARPPATTTVPPPTSPTSGATTSVPAQSPVASVPGYDAAQAAIVHECLTALESPTSLPDPVLRAVASDTSGSTAVITTLTGGNGATCSLTAPSPVPRAFGPSPQSTGSFTGLNAAGQVIYQSSNAAPPTVPTCLVTPTGQPVQPPDTTNACTAKAALPWA